MDSLKKICSYFKSFFRYFLILVLLFFSFAISYAQAQEYYVDISAGDDSNNGSSASPWKTLHHAMSQMAASRTLHVAPGVYSLANGETDSDISIGVSDILILGDPGGGTKLDLDNAINWTNGFSINSSSSVHISQIEIVNAPESGIKLESTISDIIIENCKITDSTNGVFLSNTSGVVFKKSDISRNTKGIYITDSNSTNTISKNKIGYNDIGIEIETASVSGVNEPNIINNLIYENTDTGIKITTPFSTSSAAPVILHNTIDGGSQYGIELDPDAADIGGEIKYNNITDFNYGIYVKSGSVSTYLDYNNVYNNSLANHYSITQAATSISLDPLYNDTSSHNYHLNAASPSVDAAQTSVITNDLDDNPRPKGRHPDIGCFEHLTGETLFVFVNNSNLKTTETGQTAIFKVHLGKTPTHNVTISLSSSDSTEGSVSPSSLTFTQSDWNIDKTITITGVDDNETDGDINYKIITGKASSTDPSYNNHDPEDIDVKNIDDEESPILVIHDPNIETSENGDTASFQVKLATSPDTNVILNLQTSDNTEGVVLPSTLTFTSGNWNTPQSVTITGQDDLLQDGDIDYQIKILVDDGSDPHFKNHEPDDIELKNYDNDTPGVKISPVSGLETDESGKLASFLLSLKTKPQADVTIPISSNNINEGLPSKTSITFTQLDWLTPQIIEITGVDDDIIDGDKEYLIELKEIVSQDSSYSGLDPDDVSVTNKDNDDATFTILLPQDLNTTESGGVVSFEISLNAKPSFEVIIPISSTNTDEGAVSISPLTFTPLNWDTPQTITITGLDDNITDGDIEFFIKIGPSTSSDTAFNNVIVEDIKLKNIDDDIPGITLSPTFGLYTSSLGSTAEFQIRLNTKPTSDVTINLESSNTNLGSVSPTMVIFTDQNWSTPKTITITGVFQADSGLEESFYHIITKPALSLDQVYSGKDPEDIIVENKITRTLTITTSSKSGGSVISDGINCPSDCSKQYLDGSYVTLTATPSQGSDFKYFLDQDGNTIYRNSLTIYMDKDITIDAIFGIRGNSQPEKPMIISPQNLSIEPGTSVLIQSSSFSDEENDLHKATYWKIKRYDAQQYSSPELDGSLSKIINANDSPNLTQYNLEGLEPGIKYQIKVGYLDSGSGKYSWSNEYSFTIGSLEDLEYNGVEPAIQAKNYKMISFSSFPTNPRSDKLFGLTSAYDKSVLRFGTYDPESSQYIEYPDVNIIPGKAYWILSRNGYNKISFEGVKVSSLEDIEVPLSYNHETSDGWNMIAPPNDNNYLWEDIKVVVYDPANGKTIAGPISIGELKSRYALISNPFIDPALWRWEAGEYFNDTQIIKAEKGYWIKTKAPGVSLIFSPQARGVKNRPKDFKTVKKIVDIISPKSANATTDHPPLPMDGIPLSTIDKTDTQSGCFISNID